MSESIAVMICLNSLSSTGEETLGDRNAPAVLLIMERWRRACGGPRHSMRNWRTAGILSPATSTAAPVDSAMPQMDPRIPAYHARSASLEWTDRDAGFRYQEGAWRLLAGSAHPFDQAHVGGLVHEAWDRTSNLLPLQSAGLSDATSWFGRLGQIQAHASILHGTGGPVLPYAHGFAFKAALLNSRLLTLEGSGHELHPLDWPVMIDATVEHTASAT